MDISGLAMISALASSQAAAEPYSPIDWSVEISADAVISTEPASDAGMSPLGDVSLDIAGERIDSAGRRYGLAATVRAQADSERRGLARQVTPCAVQTEACSSLPGPAQAGLLTGLHRADLFDDGDSRVALESAYAYIKLAYFDVRVGRGEGAARLEADPLPGAFRLMRADGPRVDPGGLSIADTANTLSTNSAKLTVQSRRLAGLRASLSYTPEADDCGLDVCRPGPDRAGLAIGEVDDVIEAGLSFDHRFRTSGQRWTLALSASQGRASGEFAANHEDPWAVGARATWSKGPVSLGAAWLSSNDGVDDGRYTSWAGSAAYETGPWLSALELSWARSDLVEAQGWTAQIGSSRVFDTGFVAGAGVRHSELDVDPGPANAGFAAASGRLTAGTLVFAEAGLRF